MYAFVGAVGLLSFLVSVPLAILQRRKRLKMWLLIGLVGLILFSGALAVTPSTKNEPQIGATVQPGQQQTQQSSDEKAKVALDKLMTYLNENFGGSGNPKYATSWWNLIKSVKLTVASDGRCVVTVTTDIYPDKEGEGISMNIANAVLLCDKVDVKSVTVLGKGERILASRNK